MCSLGLKGTFGHRAEESITDGALTDSRTWGQRSKWQILRRQYPVRIRTGGVPASKCGERVIHSVTRAPTRRHTPSAGLISHTDSACCRCAWWMNTDIKVGRKKKMARCMERTGVHFWILHYPIKGWAQTHTFHLHSICRQQRSYTLYSYYGVVIAYNTSC